MKYRLQNDYDNVIDLIDNLLDINTFKNSDTFFNWCVDVLIFISNTLNISYEEASYIRETFVGKYGLRELTLIPVKNVDMSQDVEPGQLKFESVDTIVTNQLTNIESDHYDPKMLLEIYRDL